MCVATARRQHPASRNTVPGGNQRRKHHKRLRQLHQGRSYHHNDQWSGYGDTAQGSGQRCRQDIQSKLVQLPAGTWMTRQAVAPKLPLSGLVLTVHLRRHRRRLLQEQLPHMRLHQFRRFPPASQVSPQRTARGMGVRRRRPATTTIQMGRPRRETRYHTAESEGGGMNPHHAIPTTM